MTHRLGLWRWSAAACLVVCAIGSAGAQVAAKPSATHPRALPAPASLSAPRSTQPAPVQPAALDVGPVYTNAGKSPKFPRMQVVLRTNELQQTMPAPGDLTLIEQGVDGPQALSVSTFASTGYGIAAAVAIDVSGSMTGRPLQVIRDSLYKFVSDARPQDSVEVITIADGPRWDVPFGADRATLRSRLQHIETRGRQTRLYDSLLALLGDFNVPQARRELTVISDGHDEGSQHTLQDVLAAAKARGIAIDAIGMTRSSPIYLRTLMSMASGTGGTFRQVHSDAEMKALIENGMAGLKASPVATFEAAHTPGDGKSHRIAVRRRGHPDLTGECDFTPPVVKSGLWRWLQDLPDWAYPLGAFAILALIAGVVLLAGGGRRRQPVPAARIPVSPAGPPPQPVYPAQAPHRRGDTGLELAATAYTRPQFATVAPQPLPARDSGSAAPQAARARSTRLAGFFEQAEGVIARLQATAGPLDGACVDVDKSRFWIGAASENDLAIEHDPTVSSRHAFLLYEDRLLFIADNHSTNGTRVNEALLRGTRRAVRNGDQIQIGHSVFVILPAL